MSVRTFRSTQTDPRRRGEEFGAAHAEQVRACVAAYRELFARGAGPDGVPVDLDGPAGLGAEAAAAITVVSPRLSAEVEGIADGAGVGRHELAAVNARTEVLARVRTGAARGECSTVAQVGPGGALLALQAWDWYEALEESWLVWEIPHADGSVTRTLTEYGIVGKIGVSSRGLGVLFNILHHRADGAGPIGAPVHVLARAVLDEAHDLNQALLRLTTAPVSASSSLTLVATGPGESAAVSVELNPERTGLVLPDEDGLLLHTNHFLSAPARDGDTEPLEAPDSVLRLDLLARRLRRRGPLSTADALTAMDSHLLGGGGLCCHPDPAQPPQAQYRTLATVVLDPAAARLDVHPGGPCTHPLTRPDRDLADHTPTSTPKSKESRVLQLKRIDNMDILTRDVDRLVDFYHGLLGLPFHLPYEKDEEWAAIDLGNVTLYLFKSEQGEHAPRRTAVNPDNAPGYDSMAFEVDDLDEAVAHLDGHVEWVDEQIEWKHPSGTWYRYRPFFDPDGNMLYVTEPHQAEA